MIFLKIPYKILDITCEPVDELYLPTFKGSSFRGVIGRTLKQAFCILKAYQNCHNCPINSKCYYAYIFETIPNHQKTLPFNFHKYPSVSHPFIIEPPEEKKTFYKKEESFSIKIILIGKAISYEPHFILAMKLAGEHGIGKENRKFIIKNYQATETLLSTIEIPTNFSFTSNKFSQIVLQFLTPLRIIYEKKLVKNLEFHHIVRSLLRRISILYYFHVSEKMPKIPAKDLISKAQEIKVKESKLQWFDWERYSYRQKRRMILGGLIGKIVFEGNVAPFFSILQAGEIFHCGKNTSFGLGKYRII